MAGENDRIYRDKRLRQLIAELESAPRNSGQVRCSGAAADGLIAAFWRWAMFGLICLGVGFWAGNYNTKVRFSLRPPAESRLLEAQGWKHDGTGVFYRWCRVDCHAPRLYGGGVIQVFEVKCVERPCGDLVMGFNVLNDNSEVIDILFLREKAVQGEARRFIVESQHASAASLELRDFSARARV